MEHLVTPQEIVNLGRPIGKVEDTKLLAFITEVEQLYIKPTIGNELYLSLLKSPHSPEHHTLLYGGTYIDKGGSTQLFMGLKTAIAYFVNAQNIMSGDYQSTRFGIVIKDGDYSQRISSKERSDFYNNTLEIANMYLRECVRYCKCVGLINNPGKVKASLGGITIRKIGK